MPTSEASGKTQNLEESRAEALQALLRSLAPEDAPKGAPLSKDHALKISQKLGELLGDEGMNEGPSGQRNEKGELLNEEGLPIIEISEPLTGSDAPVTAGAPPEDPGLAPLAGLPPTERARTRAEMDRILDILEEEERIEEEKNYELERQQRREELERRKANAKAELERLKAAKEMQKKMGKALLQNVASAREREEKAKAQQAKEDLEQENGRKQGKPRKSVSFADLPPYKEEEKPKASTFVPKGPQTEHWDDEAGARLRSSKQRQTMKFDVVERYPAKPEPPRPATPPVPQVDSDDESLPGSPIPADSDDGGAIDSDWGSSHGSDHLPSDDDEDEIPEDPVLEDDIDFDTVSHQREIALAYYEKRDMIGKDTARAMSAHSHELIEDEWDQAEVPLDATLVNPQPKPAQSKFKSSRIAQAYSTTLPTTTPSTSLGAAILPGSASTLKRAIRMGKLEDEKLVGGEEGESGDEDDSEEVKAFMAALHRGEITNAGAEQNADALIAALTKAYTAPEASDTTPDATPPAQPVVAPAPPLAKSKISKFKLQRGPVRSPALEADSGEITPLNQGTRSSPKLPTSDTVLERKPATPKGAQPMRAPGPSGLHASSPLAKPPAPTKQSPSATVVASPPFAPSVMADSPSFQTPDGTFDPMSMIVDSPSFQPLGAARPSVVPTIVASTVRESSGPRQAQAQGGSEPGAKKVSRFKAQRA